MKKKTLFFEDEDFISLVFETKTNDSNATVNIQRKMGHLLRKNGYDWDNFQWDGKYKLVEKEKSIEMPVEGVRIVSKGRKPISEEKIGAIIEMGLKGFSEREIAKTLKVGKGTVGKYLNSES